MSDNRPRSDLSVDTEARLARAAETGRDVRASFFDPHDEIEIHERGLPYWEQAHVWVFVTWRLGDSLPAEKLAAWRAEYAAWNSEHPRPWEPDVARHYREQFSGRIDRWLDAGQGACLLRRPELRTIVARALSHFDGSRYELGDFVIMPNHVHVLVRPGSGRVVADLLHGWKSYTAKRINDQLGRRGQVWQPEYWDRLVRHDSHLAACQRYIAENPARAGLDASEFTLSCTG